MWRRSAQWTDFPIDEIGFVFAQEPPASDACQLAGELIRGSRSSCADRHGNIPRTVGVFVESDDGRAARKLAEAPARCRPIAWRRNAGIMQGGSVKRLEHRRVESILGDGDADDPSITVPRDGPDRLEPYRGSVDAVLIDTAGGGTGRRLPGTSSTDYRGGGESVGFRFMSRADCIPIT